MMRGWLVFLLACGSPPPPAHVQPAPPIAHEHRPIALVVLDLEPAPPRDAATTRIANELTLDLRDRAREDAQTRLVAARELTDEEMVEGCDNDDRACTALIGRALGADYLVSGMVAGGEPRWDVALRLFDVKTRDVWTWSGVGSGEPAALAALATRAYGTLVSHVP